MLKLYIPENEKSLKEATNIYENTLRETRFLTHEPPKVGQKVYRIYGKDIDKNIDSVGAKPLGGSWTPVDPNLMGNPRSKLGLPSIEGYKNEGRFVIEGKIKDTSNITVKPADKLHGNPGGETEYVIQNPESQIEIERVSGVNPEF